jgi:hypothetical protein
LARKVRWMTVKHMNKYFARSEAVINSWREKGPQYLQPPYSDDTSRGVILEEITKPHGIYLLQNGVPTNYFAPNFHPPYSTKMRRSLIRNVINKSWDVKHRDWLSEPLPQMRGPAAIISSVMGCTNLGQLSPEEKIASVNSTLGAFHMRPDFDLVDETTTRDVGSRGASSMPDAKKDAVDARRKEERKSHEVLRSDNLQHNVAQYRQAEEWGTKPMTLAHLEDSFVDSSMPMDAMRDSSINDPIYENRTNSGSMESPQRINQWSAEFSPDRSLTYDDDADKNTFFLGDPLGRTSFCSSKDASCTDGSQAESDKDLRGTEQWHQPAINHFAEQSKLDDRRAEQFAKTKVCVVVQ